MVAMKTTVYRTCDDSALMPALIEAAEDGKQTVCLVELKARFDERRNIAWARQMERAGVHVVHGFANLKIHAKTTLIVRREGDALRRYAHIGTGNYNARHRPHLRGLRAVHRRRGDHRRHRRPVQPPDRVRPAPAVPQDPGRARSTCAARWSSRSARSRRAEAAGEPARIRIKVNSLTDLAMIDELYKASQAGAKIESSPAASARCGRACRACPRTSRCAASSAGSSSTAACSTFEAGDETTYLFGSADLMPRNLDHRIEVVVPVEDHRARDEMHTALEALLADNAQAWQLGPDGCMDQARGAGRRALARQPRGADAAGEAAAATPQRLGACQFLTDPNHFFTERSPWAGDDGRSHRHTTNVMRIGIVDVGSNTMRLLVSEQSDAGALEPVHQDRAQVGLGAAIEEHGWIPSPKLAEAGACAKAFAAQARALRCGDLRVIVTAPGRQSVNADDLLVELQRSTGVVPRVLTAHEEGRYAYLGAAATLAAGSFPIAVCDVGGGSTEIAVGPADGAPDWLSSLDIGSLRLAQPPRPAGARPAPVAAARLDVASLFSPVDPPPVELAIACVGGSARALRRMLDGPLRPRALDELGDVLARRSAVKMAAARGIGERRAATLLAGAVILAEAARRVGQPFEVAAPGLREGIAAEALAERLAA